MTLPASDLVARARQVADEVLTPHAEAVDRMALLPRSHLDALADAGLMGLGAPVADGVAGAPEAVARQVQRIVAGGCGATFFTWIQHQGPVRFLSGAPDSPARRRWLRGLAEGRLRGGVAFAYLRRPGPPAVRAEPDGTGWRITGSAPWVTGWGLVDVIAFVAGAPDGRKVIVAVEPSATGLTPHALDLVVLGATGTVRLDLDGVAVAAADVIDVWPAQRWDQQDGDGAARPASAPFGIADTAISRLRPLAPAAATALDADLADVTAAAEDLLAAPPPAERAPWREALIDVRAGSIDIAMRASQALVVATGGRAMDLHHPAQRLLREASFYLVQAQTPALRERQLLSLGGRG